MEVQVAAEFRGAPDPRKRVLLEAALEVFARHGYRKTSMEDVAQTAGVSRQGLYLHFPTKEDLFRAAVCHLLRRSHAAVVAILEAEGESLEQRLVKAFDEWVGRYVEARGAEVDDLVHACRTLLGNAVDYANACFSAEVTKALSQAGLAGAYERRGLRADQIASILRATAEGLKTLTDSREGFIEQMRIAVNALCVPPDGNSVTSSGSSGSCAAVSAASHSCADNADRGH